MKEFRLERLTYPEAEEYARMGAVALLPISPLEAHGPHLPLGVDFFGARILAELSAEMLIKEKAPAVVAPMLPYALADVAMPFTGTVSLKVETVKAIVADIARSFKRHGFRGIVIVCQHLEWANLSALQDISSELTDAGVPVITVNPFQAYADKMHAMMKGEFPELDLHAGEWETAFCLWNYPELVKKDMLKHLEPNWVNLREKLYKQGCKDFIEAGGAQCYFGDPSCATATLGQKIYEGLAKAMTEEIMEWLKDSP